MNYIKGYIAYLQEEGQPESIVGSDLDASFALAKHLKHRSYLWFSPWFITLCSWVVAGPSVCPHENGEEKPSMKMRSNLVIVIIMLIYHQNGQINQETRSSNFPLLFFFFTLLPIRDESKCSSLKRWWGHLSKGFTLLRAWIQMALL